MRKINEIIDELVNHPDFVHAEIFTIDDIINFDSVIDCEDIYDNLELDVNDEELSEVKIKKHVTKETIEEMRSICEGFFGALYEFGSPEFSFSFDNNRIKVE